MKIVLNKDVKDIGKKHDIKTVSDGYALNFLIPNGLAEIASASSLKRVDIEKKRESDEKKVKEDLLVKNLKSIHDVAVEVVAGANDKGHLFAGIHKEEIVKIVKQETEVDLLPEFIILEKPIKSVGEYPIDIKVQGKSATFKLVVKAK
jgi:large subunit ribosomal protein L9